MRIKVLSPMSGRVVPLEKVPDPVFAQHMLGDGLAIEPYEGRAVAPVSGRLSVFHSSGHAFVVQVNERVSVLVHVGLDTVQMKGQGFSTMAQVGDIVQVGQELVYFDLQAIQEAGYSSLSPIILPDLPSHYRIEKTRLEEVRAGRDTLLVISSDDER